MSPPPERDWAEDAQHPTLKRREEKKINNCIARKKSFLLLDNERRVRKAKDIHISENKANLVKRKNVKSNFKALRAN